MRILFGIQGTGNGHISRSQEIVRHLTRFAEVEVLISGAQHEVDFRLDVPTYWAHGLELAFGTQGGIGYWATVKRLKMLLLLRDIRRLPVQRYDVVVSDFEPISAWSAYLHRRPCIALSHHAAFLSPRVPRPPVKRPLAEWLMRWYAPAADAIGLHFQAYDDFIDTPIIRQAIREATITNQGHYTVYLPAFADSYLIKLFSPITTVRWEIFSKHYRHRRPSRQDHITIAPIADQAFIRSVAGCEGLVTGAGFETPAEALYLGKKLLVIPMKGQYEQQCNAAALQEMGMVASSSLHVEGLQLWIEQAPLTRVAYRHNVADVVELLLDHCHRLYDGASRSR
jgi:uncharacterized protein (TIGR00661 family)